MTPQQDHSSSKGPSHGASMGAARIASSLASNSSVSQASGAHGGSAGRSGCGCGGSSVVDAAVVLPEVECVVVVVVVVANPSVVPLAVPLDVLAADRGRRRRVLAGRDRALALGRRLRPASWQQRDRREPAQSLQANPRTRREHMSLTLRALGDAASAAACDRDHDPHPSRSLPASISAPPSLRSRREPQRPHAVVRIAHRSRSRSRARAVAPLAVSP
ncbi:hypothetical protein [Nannocystis pusilla]|uniref:hypothetical protein n=1 Tax=Nannocystis pusilla TaxID=889268 RepID=UPI003DA4A19B